MRPNLAAQILQGVQTMTKIKMAMSFIVAIFIASLLVHTVAASPVLTISSNPVNYGQNDQISAQTSPITSPMLLYINGTLVASSKSSNVSYTICSNGRCLMPGFYAVTALDNFSKEYTTQNLQVLPVAPTFTVQIATPEYGRTDIITAYPAFYNDSMSILIGGSVVKTGQGVITYTICGNVSIGEVCLPVGEHNVSVIDSSENVPSASNKTITVTPVPPSIYVKHTGVNYGGLDTITAVAPCDESLA